LSLEKISVQKPVSVPQEGSEEFGAESA